MKANEALKLRLSDDYIEATDTTWDVIVSINYNEDVLNGNTDKLEYKCEVLTAELLQKLDFVEFFDGAYAQCKIHFDTFVENNRKALLNWIHDSLVYTEQYYDLYEGDYYIIDLLDRCMSGNMPESACASLAEVIRKECK